MVLFMTKLWQNLKNRIFLLPAAVLFTPNTRFARSKCAKSIFFAFFLKKIWSIQKKAVILQSVLRENPAERLKQLFIILIIKHLC